MDSESKRAAKAKPIIRELADSGAVAPTKHFNTEAKKDDLSTLDALNVLRHGIVREPEFENGSWRYRVETQKIRVVVAFDDDEAALVLVTIMRLRR